MTRHLEAQHGRALIQWGDRLVQQGVMPELRWLFHVPNGLDLGGDRSTPRARQIGAIRASLAKAEGLRAGVWDYHLPFRSACGAFASLWVELKRPEEEHSPDGGLSDDQRTFGNLVHAQGARTAVCFRWDEAAAVILNHLRNPLPEPRGLSPFQHVNVASILLDLTPRLLGYQPVRRGPRNLTKSLQQVTKTSRRNTRTTTQTKD